MHASVLQTSTECLRALLWCDETMHARSSHKRTVAVSDRSAEPAHKRRRADTRSHVQDARASMGVHSPRVPMSTPSLPDCPSTDDRTGKDDQTARSETRGGLLIGRGSYASVYRHGDGSVRKAYTLGKACTNSIRTVDDQEQHVSNRKADDALLVELAFYREVALLHHVRHPLFCHADENALYFVGAPSAGAHVLLPSETGRSAVGDEGAHVSRRLYHNVFAANLDLPDRVALFDDLLRGASQRLMELHERGVMHRDIKADCFLVLLAPCEVRKPRAQSTTRRGWRADAARSPRYQLVDLQLCDLNMAALALGQPECGQPCYTATYRAPELDADDGTVAPGDSLVAATEVWALARALLDVVSERPLSRRRVPVMSALDVCKRASLVSHRQASVLAAMLHSDPAARPTLAHLARWGCNVQMPLADFSIVRDGINPTNAGDRCPAAAGEQGAIIHTARAIDHVASAQSLSVGFTCSSRELRREQGRLTTVGMSQQQQQRQQPDVLVHSSCCDTQRTSCRPVLVNWLMEIEALFDVPQGALFYAVAMLDAHDDLVGFDRATYQLRGLICLLHLAATCLFGLWEPPSDEACAYFVVDSAPGAAERVRACRQSIVRALGGRLVHDNVLARFCRERAAWPSSPEMQDLRTSLVLAPFPPFVSW